MSESDGKGIWHITWQRPDGSWTYGYMLSYKFEGLEAAHDEAVEVFRRILEERAKPPEEPDDEQE